MYHALSVRVWDTSNWQERFEPCLTSLGGESRYSSPISRHPPTGRCTALPAHYPLFVLCYSAMLAIVYGICCTLVWVIQLTQCLDSIQPQCEAGLLLGPFIERHPPTGECKTVVIFEISEARSFGAILKQLLQERN